MKYIIFVLGSMFLFSGCAVLEAELEVPKSEKKVLEINKTKETLEENLSSVSEEVEAKALKNDNLEESQIIINVFDDELYFEKDKVGRDKTQVVIKYLDAFSWEKKALKKVYAKYKRLWSEQQSKNFRKILEEDRYLSLCSDHKYWDNLEFEESQPKRDVLHSILLLRYLNNLTHGCPQWITSNGKVKDENSKEHIKTKQVFSLLPHGVIIEKLFSLYLPKEKDFFLLLKKHKASLEEAKKREVIQSERLEIEAYKCRKCQPNYKKKGK